MEVVLGISNRHVHLTEDDYNLLFGNTDLIVERYLVQPEQYASTSYVDIKTGKSIIKRVRVLGPFRSYTQVEISKTDSKFLGLNPPIASSGELENAEEIEIIGPNGKIKRKCAIIANRHIHITPYLRKQLGLESISEVSVVFKDVNNITFDNVKIKELEKSNLELHLDTDDSNDGLLKTGMIATIIKKQ